MSIDPSISRSVNEANAIHEVFLRYYDVFGRDSMAASEFYGEPTLMVLQNEVVMLSTRADVAAFFDEYVASLKLNGFSHSKLGDYRVKFLNSTTALFSTVTIRMKTDGTEMQRSGFTYVFLKSNAGWRIHEIIATDLDKLISGDSGRQQERLRATLLTRRRHQPDVEVHPPDVRFTPQNRHRPRTLGCPLSAKSGLQQRTSLFDHLIGRRKQFVWDG